MPTAQCYQSLAPLDDQTHTDTNTKVGTNNGLGDRFVGRVFFLTAASESDVGVGPLSLIPPASADEYKPLLQMARALNWRCPSWIMPPTALVPEILIKEHVLPGLPSPEDPHFLALAARAMRQDMVATAATLDLMAFMAAS